MSTYPPNGLTQKEVRDEADSIIRHTFRLALKHERKLFPIIRDLQDQNDEGIDYQIELLDRSSRKSVVTFSLQSKGEDVKGGIKVNKRGAGAGKIRFTLSIDHVWYYRKERPDAIILVVADVEKEILYWHSIQLDNSVEKAIAAARTKPKRITKRSAKRTHESRDQMSDWVTIYIDPANKLNAENFPRFLADVRLSTATQSFRFNTDPPTGLVPVAAPPTGRPLDDIYDQFKAQFNLLRNIPQSILGNHYPFKIGNSPLYSFGPFRMTTDNDEFFNIFKAIRKIDDTQIEVLDMEAFPGVEDVKQKVTDIMFWLTRNQVFFLHRSMNTFEEVYLFDRDPKDFDPMNLFRRLSFVRLLQHLSTAGIADPMEKAYLYMQLGNLVAAQEILKDMAAEISVGSLRAYLAFFNRFQCINRLRGHQYTNYPGIGKILQDIREVPLELTYRQCYEHREKSAIEWIHYDKFFTCYEMPIATIVAEIKQIYDRHLNGHWTRHDAISRLQSEYAAYEGFIKENLIFYDQYDNFKRVTHLFVEGIFAMYATNNKYGTRLDAMDDWMLSVMATDADPKILLDLTKAYHLFNVKYHKSAIHNDAFVDLAENIIRVNGLLRPLVDNFAEHNHGLFWNLYSDKLGAVLVLVGILELDDEWVKTFIYQLLELLDKEDFIHASHFNYITFLLHRKARLLNSETFKWMLFIVLNQPKWQINQMFIELSNIAEDINIKIDFDDKQFNELFDFFFATTSSYSNVAGRLSNASYLYTLIAAPDLQERWLKAVQRELSLEFDREAYWWLASTGVIGYDTVQFNVYKEIILQMAQKDAAIARAKASVPEPEVEKYPYHIKRPWLDQMLDLCFKFNIPLSSEELDIICSLHRYYQWVTDMDGFNYSEFVPYWLTLHHSDEFFERCQQATIVMTELSKYLSDNYDRVLLKIYFDLYGSKKKCN